MPIENIRLVSDLVIEDNVGVSGVRDDTIALAEAIAEWFPPGHVLDMGTGTGFVGLHLAKRGWKVDAVDISRRALKLANINAVRNGLQMRIYESNLLDRVTGVFDVIAFNVPMVPNENDLQNIITSLLRRNPRVSRWIVNLVGEHFEGDRFDFLTHLVDAARQHLTPQGSLVLIISKDEIEQMAAMPGVRLGRIWLIPNMPRQEVVEFQLERTF